MEGRFCRGFGFNRMIRVVKYAQGEKKIQDGEFGCDRRKVGFLAGK